MSECNPGAVASPRPLRPAARLIVLDAQGRLLMFRFTTAGRPSFWATAGGAVDAGETFEAAARRELLEETGIDADPGMEIARRESDFTTLAGVDVRAVERYFLVQLGEGATLDFSGHTAEEREWMLDHRWWRAEELAACEEIVYPVDILDIWRDALNSVAEGRAA